ncbi:MAG: response regulator [Polyangiaceae bacterium]
MAHVLVIDGEEWVASLLAGALVDAGHRVTTCHSAADGVDAAAAAPDCIVCDIALPDADGPTVARRVRGLAGPAALTPFLFLSRQGGRARADALGGGGDAWMAKPFRVAEVVAQVAALLEMSARLRGTAPSPPSTAGARGARSRRPGPPGPPGPRPPGPGARPGLGGPPGPGDRPRPAVPPRPALTAARGGPGPAPAEEDPEPISVEPDLVDVEPDLSSYRPPAG